MKKRLIILLCAALSLSALSCQATSAPATPAPNGAPPSTTTAFAKTAAPMPDPTAFAEPIAPMPPADPFPGLPRYYKDFTGQAEFSLDLDGDGKQEQVSFQLLPPAEDYAERTRLTVTSEKGRSDSVLLPLPGDPNAIFTEDIDGDGLVELFVSGDICSSDFCAWVFRYKGGKLTAAKSEDEPFGEDDGTVPPSAYGTVRNVEGNRITIEDSIDILGTWWCWTLFEIAPKGFVLQRIPGSIWMTYLADIETAFDEPDGRYLVTAREFPVTVRGSTVTTLPVGTKLVPFETDGKSIFYFVTESGERGFIDVVFDEESWEYFIDGVNAAELFVYLPYAG